MLTTILNDALSRPIEVFERIIDELTLEELHWAPEGADNTVTWLAWHTGREMDLQFAALQGAEDVWKRDGWVARFRLNLPEDSMGYGHTPAEVSAVKVTDKSLLVGYLRAVSEDARSYIASLEESALDEIVDRNWDPPVDRATRIVSIIDDASQHAGQADYVAGMIKNLR